MRPEKYPLLNQNSCGQGEYLDHIKHIHYPIAEKFGYKYSHSTNIGTLAGNYCILIQEARILYLGLKMVV